MQDQYTKIYFISICKQWVVGNWNYSTIYNSIKLWNWNKFAKIRKRPIQKLYYYDKLKKSELKGELYYVYGLEIQYW